MEPGGVCGGAAVLVLLSLARCQCGLAEGSTVGSRSCAAAPAAAARAGSQAGRGQSDLMLLQQRYSTSTERSGGPGKHDGPDRPRPEPESPPGPASAGVDVPARLATFNVYYKELELPERVNGISSALANVSADITVVTELWEWNGKARILEEVRRKAQRNYVFCSGGDFQEKSWDGDILYDADLWQSLRDGVLDMGDERGLSWALLQHRASGRKLFVYGAHPLCCGNEDIHLQNAMAFAEHLAAQPERPETPAIIMGDFNAFEDWWSTRLYRGEWVWAFNRWWKLPIAFEDSFRALESNRYADGTTFKSGVRFDYIFTEWRDPPAFAATSSSIWREAPGSSDHYPLMADVLLRG
uniref:Endonuclease/exonuclease/phosphatase domain-containing protein n=1 Tax=Alexandrium monilatum TaxID=311494 RepID=A0A7S4Q3C3_9DINO